MKGSKCTWVNRNDVAVREIKIKIVLVREIIVNIVTDREILKYIIAVLCIYIIELYVGAQ